MSCPLNRNKFAGSGYQKPTANSSELDTKMKQMQQERERQDAILYPQTAVQVTFEATKQKPEQGIHNGTR